MYLEKQSGQKPCLEDTPCEAEYREIMIRRSKLPKVDIYIKDTTSEVFDMINANQRKQKLCNESPQAREGMTKKTQKDTSKSLMAQELEMAIIMDVQGKATDLVDELKKLQND